MFDSLFGFSIQSGLEKNHVSTSHRVCTHSAELLSKKIQEVMFSENLRNVKLVLNMS